MGRTVDINCWPAGCRAVRLLMTAVALVAFIGIFSAGASAKTVHLVAFGDSLTAGYGLADDKSFPAQLQAALKAKGYDVRVSNAGVSGDTTGAGLARFDWAVPDDADGVILELGANDALRGIAPKTAKANLSAILERLKKRKLPVLIAGMKAPANWGEAYVKSFDKIFPELAKAYGYDLYPFFLAGVVGKRQLNQADGLHPTAEGVAIIVQRMLPSVERLIGRVKEKVSGG